MQFRDLQRQYQELKQEIDDSVLNVMKDAHYIMGQPVEELEEKLKQYTGRKHCITCANGTDALSLVMMAWNISEGDAVFVPDFTFFSTAEIVSFAGATPVFVDSEQDTFNMSSEHLEQQIKRVLLEGKLQPKAIVPVDLFGQPADYESLITIAQKYHLLVLEDGAQGFGGSIKGKKACSFGEASTTSFFPAKPLGCYGDGGAIFTDNDEMASLLRSYRIHGKGTQKYDNIRIGMNSRLDTIQAAVLLVKFKAFVEVELEQINAVAQLYHDKLHTIVCVPKVREHYYSSWAQYTIRLDSMNIRDGLQEYLRSKAIPSMIYYPKGMHTQKAFEKLGYTDEELPIATKLCDTVLSLPIHPYMHEDEIEMVVNAVKDYLQRVVK